MSYKIIYPKKLQILDSEGDCKLMGSLVHDWQHYGIITKNHTFEITLKKNFDQWLIDEIQQNEIDASYISDFKNALNWYISKKFNFHLPTDGHAHEIRSYYFENILFDVSKNKDRFISNSRDQ
jgi:hypothetical protein